MDSFVCPQEWQKHTVLMLMCAGLERKHITDMLKVAETWFGKAKCELIES